MITRSCQIRVKGHLGPEWSDWFDGLAVLGRADGETLIQGTVVDEAALYGLLGKVRDLGLPLLGLSVLSEEDSAPERR
ncbi:MAG: hypothetical protein ACYC4L_17085 [Chloroflexota bacterium]